MCQLWHVGRLGVNKYRKLLHNYNIYINSHCSGFENFKHFYETYSGQDEENAVLRAASKCKALSATFFGNRNFTEEQKSVLVKLLG